LIPSIFSYLDDFPDIQRPWDDLDDFEDEENE